MRAARRLPLRRRRGRCRVGAQWPLPSLLLPSLHPSGRRPCPPPHLCAPRASCCAHAGVRRRPVQGRRALDVVRAHWHQVPGPRGTDGVLLPGRPPPAHAGGDGDGVVVAAGEQWVRGIDRGGLLVPASGGCQGIRSQCPRLPTLRCGPNHVAPPNGYLQMPTRVATCQLRSMKSRSPDEVVLPALLRTQASAARRRWESAERQHGSVLKQTVARLDRILQPLVSLAIAASAEVGAVPRARVSQQIGRFRSRFRFAHHGRWCISIQRSGRAAGARAAAAGAERRGARARLLAGGEGLHRYRPCTCAACGCSCRTQGSCLEVVVYRRGVFQKDCTGAQCGPGVVAAAGVLLAADVVMHDVRAVQRWRMLWKLRRSVGPRAVVPTWIVWGWLPLASALHPGPTPTLVVRQRQVC